MTIKEVFPNPTVKNIIFQIRYPNLFFLENKIGDIQIRIMKHFPNSQLLLKNQIVFAEVMGPAQLEELSKESGIERGQKIWQFTSEDGVKLNILQGSLDISSQTHITYNNPEGSTKFRDVIKSVLDPFFELTQIPLIQRIGLRYIDDCPMPDRTSAAYRTYYNTCFPLERFPIEDAIELQFLANVKRGEHNIRFLETIKENQGKLKLTLDFDGYTNNVKSEDWLSTTDKLHDAISLEYENSLRDPVFRIMRQGKES